MPSIENFEAAGFGYTIIRFPPMSPVARAESRYRYSVKVQVVVFEQNAGRGVVRTHNVEFRVIGREHVNVFLKGRNVHRNDAVDLGIEHSG